jgi:hypothetical protein
MKKRMKTGTRTAKRGHVPNSREFGTCPHIVIPIFALLLISGPAKAVSAPQTKWSGSRTTPVHVIPLKDEFSQPIYPTESNPLPFSARTTCTPCHDYEVIKRGWHFNAASSSPAGRPGEPWVWVDERTGTLLPLSYRPWPGTWNPRQLGLSAWDFTLLFGRHVAGGGISEPDDKEMTPGSRWNVSGKVEINCLGCHGASRLQNQSEWAKQILRQNFRWAATAASGLGEVGGMSSRLGPTWDIFDGPNPDDSEWAVAPFVKYDKTLFDGKQRAFFDLSYKPDDSRCLDCHSSAPVSAKKFEFEADVHSAAGIKCADCHRHDIGHDMIRGYEGEAADRPGLPAGDFTCKACHLGSESGAKEKIRPGRFGAPYPRHKGIPEVHFERLACTVCHSGPLPEKEPTRIRTARANRLGIFGAADWTTPLPAILEPVYVRDKNTLLTPQRLMWPAFWAKVSGKTVAPLKPDQVQAAAGDILFPEKAVTRILTALFNLADLDGTPVMVMDAKAYEMNLDGGLNASTFESEFPEKGFYWAIKKDGNVTPLVPFFDPSNPEASADAEARIQAILDALSLAEAAPGRPAILYKGFRYRLIDGNFDKSETKERPVPAPEFVWLKDGKAMPFISDFEKRTIAALSGLEQTLTEEQVGLVLKALGETDHAYVSGGKMFRLASGGKLVAQNDSAAAAVAWPFAHEVRPARQALGVNGCTDCHRGGSEFFFAKVRGIGPLKTANVAVRSASSFMGVTKPYHWLFGLSFTIRPAFKIALAIAAVVIGSLLLIVFLIALGRFTGLIAKKRP